MNNRAILEKKYNVVLYDHLDRGEHYIKNVPANTPAEAIVKVAKKINKNYMFLGEINTRYWLFDLESYKTFNTLNNGETWYERIDAIKDDIHNGDFDVNCIYELYISSNSEEEYSS